MINAYYLEAGRLRQHHVSALEELRSASTVWMDFFEATDAERAWARETYGFKLPDDDEEDEEAADIEASARFYVEDTGELQPIVIAEMETKIPSITVGEAVMQLELGGQRMLVFRNEGHGGVNVVYRRDDGNIGWIDPRNSK